MAYVGLFEGRFYESLARSRWTRCTRTSRSQGRHLAGIVRLVKRLFEEIHEAKATRQQHVMFQTGHSRVGGGDRRRSRQQGRPGEDLTPDKLPTT